MKRGHLNVPVVGVAKAGWNLDQLKARARDSLEKHGGVDAAAFDELIKAGKVRALGASNFTAPRLAESLKVSAARGLPCCFSRRARTWRARAISADGSPASFATVTVRAGHGPTLTNSQSVRTGENLLPASLPRKVTVCPRARPYSRWCSLAVSLFGV